MWKSPERSHEAAATAASSSPPFSSSVVFKGDVQRPREKNLWNSGHIFRNVCLSAVFVLFCFLLEWCEVTADMYLKTTNYELGHGRILLQCSQSSVLNGWRRKEPRRWRLSSGTLCAEGETVNKSQAAQRKYDICVYRNAKLRLRENFQKSSFSTSLPFPKHSDPLTGKPETLPLSTVFPPRPSSYLCTNNINCAKLSGRPSCWGGAVFVIIWHGYPGKEDGGTKKKTTRDVCKPGLQFASCWAKRRRGRAAQAEPAADGHSSGEEKHRDTVAVEAGERIWALWVMLHSQEDWKRKKKKERKKRRLLIQSSGWNTTRFHGGQTKKEEERWKPTGSREQHSVQMGGPPGPRSES